MDKELKPCPKCSSKDLDIDLEYDEDIGEEFHWVVCNSCENTKGSFGDMDNAIIAWNDQD